MAIIDLCGSVGANTGAIKCDPRRANFKTIIVGGASFNSAQYSTAAAFKTAFQAATKLATGASGKLYPFPEFVGVTPNTEANRTATLGNGTVITLSEGRPSYTADLRIGTNLEKAIRKFNGAIVPVYAFDDSGKVWGKLDSTGKFVGTAAEIFVSGSGFGDYNNASLARVSISFQSASDFYDYAAFVDTGFNISDLEGLLDITLSVVSHTTNVYNVAAKFESTDLAGDVNVYDNYSAALVAGLWYAKRLDTGATIAITSVALNSAAKTFTVTLDSTTHTALPANTPIEIGWVSPATLDAADVTGVESIPVATTK